MFRILHFGDSHLASDSSGQTYGHFFRAQYGDGGPGLGLPWVTRMTGATAHATPGWHRSRKAEGDGRMGLNGGFLETWQTGEVAALEAAFSRFRLYLLKDPAGGKVEIRVDGRLQNTADLRDGPAGLTVLSPSLPPRAGLRQLEIRTTSPGRVRVLGVALETGPGAVYSPLAFNGARASWMRSMGDDLFRGQVEAEAPDLIMLAFGTNEANDRDFNPEAYRKDLQALLARLRMAAPRAALVLVGPPDGRLRPGTATSLARVIEVQSAEASAAGARFIDQQKAMGGTGAMSIWSHQGWANPDGVHLTPTGYRNLAQLVIGKLAFPAATPAGLTLKDGRPAAPVPANQAIHTFRNAEGVVFITDDPAKVDDHAGKWLEVFHDP